MHFLLPFLSLVMNAVFHFPPSPRSGGRACVNLVANPVKIQFRILRKKSSRGSAARAQVAPAATVATILQSLFSLKLAILAFFGHLGPNMLPRRSQLDAKIAQESPTYGQDRPREPDSWPRSPKILPKSLHLNPQDPKM